MSGISCLEALLERLENGSVRVRHLRIADKHRVQLMLLCEAMDSSSTRSQAAKKGKKRTDPVQVSTQHRDNCEAALRARLGNLEQCNRKKEQLASLFSLCSGEGIGKLTVKGRSHSE